jgi:S1-C subfamily serine protease
MRLMRDGRVRRAVLGFAGQTIMLDARLSRGLRRTSPTAVQIVEVITGGAIDRAGLRKGDVILAVDEQAIQSIDDLHRYLTAEVVGKPSVLTVLTAAGLQRIAVTPEADT